MTQCALFGAFFHLKRGEIVRKKIKVSERHCKGCLWLTSENVCSYSRCIRYYGFKAEVQKQEKKNN